MAESQETLKIKLTIKTPKDKKEVEIGEEATVQEVTTLFSKSKQCVQLLSF